MKRYCVLWTVGAAAVLATAPAQAATLPVVFGVIAGTAVAVALLRPGRDAWAYTDKYGWVGGSPADVSTINAPLAGKPGTSNRIVSACRDAIAKNAQRYDLASLEAVGAGKQVRVNGRTVVPLQVRAIYKVRGVHEVKRTTVRCEIDQAGRVVRTS